MKRIVSMLVLSCVVVSLAFAQSEGKKKKSAGGADEQAITKLEEEWGVALVKKDQAVIDRIVSPDWMLSLPDGKQQTKMQADTDLKSGVMDFASFKIDELKVHVYGDAAIAFGLETEKSTYKGEDMSGQYRFTDVFVKRDGKWQCVATHVSKVMSDKKP